MSDGANTVTLRMELDLSRSPCDAAMIMRRLLKVALRQYSARCVSCGVESAGTADERASSVVEG